MRTKKELNKIGKSVFLETFGNSPMNKTLDFLLVFSKFDYCITDICKNAGVGRTTMWKGLLSHLLKNNIITETRIGMYKLNENNKVVKEFIKFYWNISNKEK